MSENFSSKPSGDDPARIPASSPAPRLRRRRRTANVFVLVERVLIARVQSKEHYYVQQYAVSSTKVVKEEDKLSEF